MAGDQAQHQRRLIIMVKIGSVHRDHDVPALTYLVRHPAGETVPNIDAIGAQQPVHLLDRVLYLQAPGLSQRLTNQSHRQRGRRIVPSVAPASGSTRLACRSDP
jgi:hypothetical protein